MTGEASDRAGLPAPDTRALQGVLVLDLGQIYNGPYCTMLLRQLGATIIKIEPTTGEPIRWRGDGVSQSAAFSLLNGGKQGLSLNLKNDDGKRIFLELVERADVVVENFAPGTMERLGLGYDVLSELNPRLVFASGKGFASGGRYQNLRAMDITVQAMTGVMATTGFDEQPPVKTGPAVADFLAGTHLATATVAALYQREATGDGQYLEVAMQDVVLPSLTSNIAGYLDTGGTAPERVGNRHGGLSVAPYNVYPTIDGWVAILCIRDKQWEALCEVSGRTDLLKHDELGTSLGRVRKMDVVDQAISQWTTSLTTDALVNALRERDIPNSPVRSLHDVIVDDDLREREIMVPVDDHGKTSYTFGNMLNLHASSAVMSAPPPQVGEHNANILQQYLNLTDDDVDSLRASGAL